MADGTSEIERGRAIKERFEALGYGYRKFEKLTAGPDGTGGVGRKLLHRAFEGKSSKTSYTAIEAHLDRLEARAAGKPTTTTPEATVRPIGDPADDLVEVSLEGNFGVRVIVKAPLRDKDQVADLAAQIYAAMNKPTTPGA